ncbi:MAG TPA: flagellar biosynthesis protein FlgH, partial [Candidatus Lambdaproteobacteria bacterium]|nr:flagellar biosynthesis protein FlgH [Candidatus Lambdaproteobacteria bacterium]
MSQLYFSFSRLFYWFLAAFLVLSLAGCLPPRPQPRPPADVLAAKALKKQNEKLKL